MKTYEKEFKKFIREWMNFYCIAMNLKWDSYDIKKFADYLIYQSEYKPPEINKPYWMWITELISQRVKEAEFLAKDN